MAFWTSSDILGGTDVPEVRIEKSKALARKAIARF